MAQIIIVNEISVDVADKSIIQPIVVKQFDNKSRFIKATITNMRAKVNIAYGSTVLFNAKRADDSSDSFAGVVNSDGTVTVPITYWMTALDDTVECDITIIGDDETKLTTTRFSIDVEKASNNALEPSEDDGDDTILLNLMSRVGALETDVSDIMNTDYIILSDLGTIQNTTPLNSALNNKTIYNFVAAAGAAQTFGVESGTSCQMVFIGDYQVVTFAVYNKRCYRHIDSYAPSFVAGDWVIIDDVGDIDAALESIMNGGT